MLQHNILFFLFDCQTWKDEYLVWNTSRYGGVDTVYLEPADIWTPDLMSYTK